MKTPTRLKGGLRWEQEVLKKALLFALPARLLSSHELSVSANHRSHLTCLIDVCLMMSES